MISEGKNFSSYILATKKTSLTDCLYFLKYWENMYIVIIIHPVYDVKNFVIKHSFLIKPFSYITKKSGQNVNVSRKKIAFNMKNKGFFIIFKGLSIVRKCLRPESGP